MPRPEQRMVTFSIDGRDVTAPENLMLVDAAKYGDVEIPVFCYEPKLGNPVGACRMCLVEIEGIPKLQTGCSTPVKDGMVVHTQTDRVRTAQQAVVEFLLVNHPLDCPVCDKGGECPLQDITFGWGAGRSRFIEPKRHFEKPLALSPLIAIDRERCILCYRCVRFSQEVSEDYQLVLRERGAHSYVGTYDSRPYVAPFSGNIIELCPVGALTSRAYRFRARPWEIEGGGSICTLCPSQCNVTFTVRDERVLRVLARDNPDVDDGWLCDKGRFAYQSIHVDERLTQPHVRDGGVLRPVSWERALGEAASALGKARGGKTAAIAGGATTNEEGFLLQRLVREALDSPHLDSRAGGKLDLSIERALAMPALQATVADLEFAHAVLVLDCDPIDDSPILDLRIRKGARRRKVKVAVATSRPSALDGSAAVSVRYAPGAGEAFLAAIDAALQEDGGQESEDRTRNMASAAGVGADAVREVARTLSADPDVVIVYGERLLSSARAEQAAMALLNVATRLRLGDRAGAGLLEIPAATNARGLREAGVLPGAGPGLANARGVGHSAQEMAAALAEGELTTLYLLGDDPLRTRADRELWQRAYRRATTIIAHASVLTEGLREHATVVFPSEAYAEKEGTVTHPDGRIQRLRPAIGHAGEVRTEWTILADIARRLGLDLGVLTGPMATAQLAGAVPFYAGLTLEELGGRGVRWQDRDAAASAPVGAAGPFELEHPPRAAGGDDQGRLRLGTFRSIWASPECEVSPALKFLHPTQKLELSPADAQRLGIANGDPVLVGSNGTRVRGVAVIRAAVPEGSAFLEDGLEHDGANALTNGVPPLVEVMRA